MAHSQHISDRVHVQVRTQIAQDFHSKTELQQRISPLTANIYFPAIPTLVDDFHKSTELINLTVTVYMIMQGIGMLLRLRVYVPSI